MPTLSRRVALLLTLASAAAAEPAFTVEALLASLAEGAPRRARFTETRRFAALEAPMQLSGWLAYENGRLLKVTDAERLEVDGTRVVITAGSEPPRVLDIGIAPGLRAAIDAIRAPLSGDVAALRRAFTPTLDGTPAAWTLHLAPRAEAGLRAITLAGQGAAIARIRIEQSNGDEQSMVLSPW